MLEPDHMRGLLHQECRRVSEGAQVAETVPGVKILRAYPLTGRT
jgi:hypothetical protein